MYDYSELVLTKESLPSLEKSIKTTSVARATGVVSIVTLASRVLGMVRDILIANYFGAGFATDAFFTAFKIPNLLRRLVAEGSLSTAFIPVISDELEKGTEAVSDALRKATGFCLILTIVLTGVGLLLCDEITLLFAIGWSGQPEKLQLASDLLRIMFPYVIIISLTALSAGTLNAMGHFAWAAAAPAILNIAFITAILFFSPSFAEPIFSLPLALIIGGILGLIPMALSLRSMGLSLWPKSPFGSTVVRRLLKLMLPAVISSSVYQIMVFLNSIFVTMLTEGAPSWLYFADRLFQFPLGVFSIAVATAVLPSLARHATKNDTKGFSKLLTETLGWVGFITIPASAGLILLSLPIVQVIYQSGVFTESDSQNTAIALIGFSIGLWPLSCLTVIIRAFLAKKNTTTPAVISVFSILLNIVLALSLMGSPIEPNANIGTRAVAAIQALLPAFSFGHVGLAMASSIASLVSLIALSMLIKKKIQVELGWGQLTESIVKTGLATAAMSAALWFVGPYLENISNPIAHLLVLILVGIATYFTTSLLLKSKEMHSSMQILRKQLS